jgi:chromosome segregation ATPase
MKAAGFDGFVRGEKGSTREHLEVTAYKLQQDKKRLEAIEGEIDNISSEKVQKQKEVAHLVEATKVRTHIAATQTEIESMAKPSKSGNSVIVSNADWLRVSDMAKRCTLLDIKMKDTDKQIKDLRQNRDKWKKNYENLWNEVKDFIKAIRSIPTRLREFIVEHKTDKTHKKEIR